MSEKENTKTDNRKYLERDEAIINKMLNNLTADKRSVLKHFIGNPVSKVTYAALVKYFGVVDYYPNNGWSKDLEASFFAACFMSAFDIFENGNIPVEDVIKKIYKNTKTSDGTKHQIEELFQKEMDNRASNIRSLCRILSYSDRSELKNVDVAKMLHDLRYWDNADILKSQKSWWARRVLCQN